MPVNDYPEINFSMIANPLTFLTMLPLPLGLFRGAGLYSLGCSILRLVELNLLHMLYHFDTNTNT